MIAGPKELTTTSDRLSGLRQASAAARRSLLARRTAYADFTRDAGFRAANELLDADRTITALATHNDRQAIGALAAVRARGLSVPADLSIIGFDDLPIAMDVTPALTTVRLPLEEIGARALTLALDTHRSGKPLVETRRRGPQPVARRGDRQAA